MRKTRDKQICVKTRILVRYRNLYTERTDRVGQYGGHTTLAIGRISRRATVRKGKHGCLWLLFTLSATCIVLSMQNQVTRTIEHKTKHQITAPGCYSRMRPMRRAKVLATRICTVRLPTTVHFPLVRVHSRL